MRMQCLLASGFLLRGAYSHKDCLSALKRILWQWYKKSSANKKDSGI